ncbi:hypothetical protein A2U01_0004826 [Trifolium medium]|uniref:Uncharacterized protein n=1 Tax=Trifolium medium TaxID=97028 RepID=A0A392M983_9FABA|nr:hypothetical protein [Trifolium medium]
MLIFVKLLSSPSDDVREQSWCPDPAVIPVEGASNAFYAEKCHSDPVKLLQGQATITSI